MANSNDIVLQTHQLCKYFGQVRAVDGIDLSVRRAEVFGFLGPNGSGKTTTIAMALGLLHPTAGEIEVLGEPVTPRHTTVLDRVGSLVGAPAMIPSFSARENLLILAKLHRNTDARRVQEILDLVGLSAASERKVSGFSLGMKQRLGLGAALLHRPELLILDEPTNGLDPAGMREIRELLRGLADQGITVFLSTHLLNEVEQICDRVAVLNQGRVVMQGAVNTLLGSQAVVKVRVPEPQRAAHVLETLPGITQLETNGTYIQVEGVPSKAINLHLVKQGIVPSEILTTRASLESVFLQLTQ